LITKIRGGFLESSRHAGAPPPTPPDFFSANSFSDRKAGSAVLYHSAVAAVASLRKRTLKIPADFGFDFAAVRARSSHCMGASGLAFRVRQG
jgi:hypothetical protein